ncbi:hypothetical protein [Flavihumibacter profundi]|uniref:hypothetical protein n=1 Tax=Flavihumibacter profundi TaxID=2716883 RepID=UPI001CC368B1|nr:hypothetical protein [Flavihumibacter profundi]MBZ5859427.1 hypothetical protein [Flavihumibacter profundi]
MENEVKKSIFYRAYMTTVFTGISTTILTMLYDLVIVDLFNFPSYAMINVATLIFFVNILFLAIGFIYYGFISLFKKGDIFFTIVSILLTVFLVWEAEAHTVNMQFRDLLTGIIIIIGIAASLAIPFLFHNKKFEEYIL